MSENQVYMFDFETSYNQFYIVGDRMDDAPNAGDENDDERLIVGKNALTVITESYGHIRGEIQILSKERTDLKLDDFDHIVEGGWVNESGKLELLNCPNSDVALSVKLTAGKYKVRIYTSGVEEDMEDDFESTDRYVIEVWPSTDLKLRVIKQIK